MTRIEVTVVVLVGRFCETPSSRDPAAFAAANALQFGVRHVVRNCRAGSLTPPER